MSLVSLDAVVQWFSADPMLVALQVTIFIVAGLLIFFVFYATRDIMLRTHSFLYQLLCIILVACFPVIGFLLYFLFRPARTVKEREMYDMLHKLTHKHHAPAEHAHKKEKKEKEEK